MTLKEFIKKWEWQKVDYDGYYWYQCTDLVRQYTTEVFWQNYKPIWNANTLFRKEWGEPYIKIENKISTLPKPWDICVWGLSPYWHIAIVVEATLLYFDALEQNWGKWEWEWTWSDKIRIKRYYYRDVVWFIRHTDIKTEPMNDFNTYRGVSYPKKYKGLKIKRWKTSTKWLRAKYIITPAIDLHLHEPHHFDILLSARAWTLY